MGFTCVRCARSGPLFTAGATSRSLMSRWSFRFLRRQLLDCFQLKAKMQQIATQSGTITARNAALKPAPSFAAPDNVVVPAADRKSKVASRSLTRKTVKLSAPPASSSARLASSPSAACKKSRAEELTASESETGMVASKETCTLVETAPDSVPAAVERRRPSKATPVISTMSAVAVGSTAATPEASAAPTARSPCSKARARSAGSDRAREKLPVRRATAAGAVVVACAGLAAAAAVVAAEQVLGHLATASGMPQSTMLQYHSSVLEVTVDPPVIDAPVEVVIDVAVPMAVVLIVVTVDVVVPVSVPLLAVPSLAETVEGVAVIVVFPVAVVLAVVTVDVGVPVGVPLVAVPALAETVEGVAAIVVAQLQGQFSCVSCREQSR